MDDGRFFDTRLAIGKRLRERRKELGLTQSDLSELLGHGGPTRISQIELGRSRLYADELPNLCQTLGCSLTDLVSEPTETSSADTIELIQGLDFETKERLVSLIKSFLAKP